MLDYPYLNTFQKNKESIILTIIFFVVVIVMFSLVFFKYKMDQDMVRVGNLHARLAHEEYLKSICETYPTELEDKDWVINKAVMDLNKLGIRNVSYQVFGRGDYYIDGNKIQKIDENSVRLKYKADITNLFVKTDRYKECKASNNTNCEYLNFFIPNPRSVMYSFKVKDVVYYFLTTWNPSKQKPCDMNKYYMLYGNIPFSEIDRIYYEKMNLFTSISPYHTVERFKQNLNK